MTLFFFYFLSLFFYTSRFVFSSTIYRYMAHYLFIYFLFFFIFRDIMSDRYMESRMVYCMIFSPEFLDKLREGIVVLRHLRKLLVTRIFFFSFFHFPFQYFFSWLFHFIFFFFFSSRVKRLKIPLKQLDRYSAIIILYLKNIDSMFFFYQKEKEK